MFGEFYCSKSGWFVVYQLGKTKMWRHVHKYSVFLMKCERGNKFYQIHLFFISFLLLIRALEPPVFWGAGGGRGGVWVKQ